MTINSLIVVLGLAGLLLFISAACSIRGRRVGGGLFKGATALLLFAVASAALLIATNLRTYSRLTAEQPAGELQFTRVGDHLYNTTFTFPSGEHDDFALRGDEWQVDAQMIKWSAFANLVGFDTAFRLDRISGRYTNIDDERNLPRTVYPLHPTERIDLWELVHRYQSRVPWVDALYGTATFLPMADGALYEITVSQSGLLARPLNQAARAAVRGWR